ncbi:MAG: hypothetical protein AAFY15_06810 [Cyanobacteria bacterium J06648_11]
MDQTYQSPAGARFAESILLVPLPGSEDSIAIAEMPLVTFEQFYSLWQVAMNSFEDGEFFEDAYCFNRTFRDACDRALALAGITDPTRLSVRQLKELLYPLPDGRSPLLFEVNFVSPKFRPKKETTTIRPSIGSRLRGLWPLKYWATQS